MKLRNLPTALLPLLLSSTSASTTNNHTTLTFDTLTTTSGLGAIPNPHHHLSFTSYSVLNPHSPSLKYLISPHDTNCAISSPNALLGSRKCEGCDGASFGIANAEGMKEEGLEAWFTLCSFWVKPLDAPEPGSMVRVKGYREGVEKREEGVEKREEVLEWEVDFPSGFHDMFEVRIEEFSKKKWDHITKVEIVADFGYAALDWEFCVDDLVVQFFQVGEDDGDDGEKDRVGMGRGQEVLREEM